MHKKKTEIDQVAEWIRSKDGLKEVNMKMDKKYGENLNSFAFGGRNHMKVNFFIKKKKNI